MMKILKQFPTECDGKYQNRLITELQLHDGEFTKLAAKVDPSNTEHQKVFEIYQKVVEAKKAKDQEKPERRCQIF